MSAPQILALFESSCHPQYSNARAEASLQIMDNIIRTLGLTQIDKDDPDVCQCLPDNVPTVFFPPNYVPPRHCACPTSVPLGPNVLSPTSLDHSVFYRTHNPDWDYTSSEEMRREECRRICWSALNLVASYTAQCAALHDTPMELYLSDPSNVSAALRHSPGPVI